MRRSRVRRGRAGVERGGGCSLLRRWMMGGAEAMQGIEMGREM